MNITVYSRNNCMQCKMTKKFLNAHHIPYVEHNLNQEPQYRQILKSKGYMSVPVIENNEGLAFTGFQPDKLNELSNQVVPKR